MTKFFSVVILTLAVCTCSKTEKAAQLLEYNETSKLFLLHDEALNLISSLKQPIRVVSAVGDARIGKSTSLNFIQSHWINPNDTQFNEVFPTSDSLEGCTKGIWISTVELKHGSLLIMDVEGTDLGNDAVTDHVSIFTALMSSGMVVFPERTITNHVIDFLFRVSRLSEVIFRDSQKTLENFPRLRIALRTKLKTPREKLREFVLNALVRTNHHDALDKKREKIAAHFPEEHIEASLVPDVSDSDSFHDYETLKKIGYVTAMLNLTEHLKTFPSKKTLGGGLMDGLHLKSLASKLVQAVNENKLLEFDNSYIMYVEKYVCASSYEEFVRPLLDETADTIENVMEEKLRMFSKGCGLEEIRNQTKSELQKTIAHKRNIERLQIELEEEKNNLEIAIQQRTELEKKHNHEIDEKKREVDLERAKSIELNERLITMQNELKQVVSTVDELRSQVQHLTRAQKKAKKSSASQFYMSFSVSL